MGNSTETYWSVNGVSLQTLAWNVSTWGGNLQSPPPLRGSDVVIPYVPGATLMPRVPDSRTVTLEMWVIGADTNGKIPTGETMRAEFEKNFKRLRDLFWNQGKPISLTKRWKEYGSAVVKSATAQAVYAGGFEPQMNGSQRASFSVDLFLADPFFYGPEEDIDFSATATSNNTVDILGDYETDAISIAFEGVRNNVRLTNITESVYVNVNSALAAGATLTLSVRGYSATLSNGGVNENVVRNVTYLGHVRWFVLSPGSQSLSLSSTSGTGPATITYKPKYL